jgi:hypothetical protein
MKKYLVLLFLIVLASSAICTQTWVKQLPMDGLPHWAHNDTKLCNVIAAIDGGYIAQGYKTNSSEDGWAWHDFNILWKLDEEGNVLQRTTIDRGQTIVSMVSNGVDRYYFLAQESQGGETLLFVLDTGLNLLETYNFRITNGYSIVLYDMQYADDGLVFAGKDYYQPEAIAIKTDFQFTVVWQSDLFPNYGSGFITIEPYNDGWMCVGRAILACLTSSFETLWTYESENYVTSLFDCRISSNNDIYLLGYYKLWKINSGGQDPELIADNIPADYWPLNVRVSLDILPDGNVVYISRSDTGDVLHCYSPDGVHQWSRSYNTNIWATYFGTGSKNLLVMPDGSIIFLLFSRSDETYSYLIKTDMQGNVVANDDPIIPVPVASIVAYPQPASNRLTLSIKSELPGDLSYSIYNIKGQKFYTGEVSGHQREQSIDLDASIIESMPNGIYLVNLKQKDRTIASCKVVIVK